MSLFKSAGARRVLKWGGIVALGGVVVAGIALGPMLVGYVHFAESIEGASKASAAVGGAWPRVSDACLPCHGAGGNPVSPFYARLAGQPKAYLVQQLNTFASGERANPTMSPLALDLSATDIDRLAAFYAAQPVVVDATAFVAEPARVKQGETLAKSANCAACHGAAMQGQDLNPRLAGQNATYLAKQLHDFKSGARRDPQRVMTTLAAGMSDKDIENLAHYFASLAAPGLGGHPASTP